MEEPDMFYKKEMHNVLISESFFRVASSHQDLERLISGYLKKNYKGYNLVEIDANRGFAVCEKGEIPDE
ncbi:hypothetical protein [Bacillus cytotoxicus]|uniref:hypothetical protein n=1 Tax=Bacillus cytotoxicus TaxID=580165 RepID=UPI003B77C6D6